MDDSAEIPEASSTVVKHLTNQSLAEQAIGSITSPTATNVPGAGQTP
jgi:hypothetical protein